MNSFSTPPRRGLLAGAACFVAVALLCGCKRPAPAAPAKPLTPIAAKTEAAAAAPAHDSNQFLSVFEDLPPAKGKDPFFPTSHRREPAAPAMAAAKVRLDPTLVLKGIVGSAGRRIAVINSETMQVGEESPVRIPGGHVRVKCLEIGVNYVVVQVEGETQPKKLEMDQKK
ncbi:MAG TPA: hypothetical protein VHB20_04445 [Verrucomicrobiae bacterium]|jgi:hypothetical protein|nr:hypothetical protein [Verrucomicrobiae bacterium]